MENLKEEVNELMIAYKENINVVATINNELAKKLGIEHYLTDFSSNLIRALNQYEKFVFIIDDKLEFVKIILKFSEKVIDFFNMTPPELIQSKNIFKKKRILKKNYESNMSKVNDLMSSMNEINEFIDSKINNTYKKYLDEEKN